MSFILRILFSGLIVFVPSQDGQKLEVFLLNVDHAHHLSDGTALPSHKPLLLARAGACSGDCPSRDSAIAQYIYADRSTSVALDSLESAVSGGGAWLLDGSELSVQKGNSSDPALPALVLRTNVRGSSGGVLKSIPTTSTEREDFSWIADLDQICADCSLDPAIHDTVPPGLIAARFTLRTGTVSTYSVARIGSYVTPANFKRLDGSGSASSYSQAVASWVGADVTISGATVKISEAKFNGDPGRSMTLTPDSNGLAEVAVLNLPPFVPPASSINDAPQVGKHFEMYYDLAETPPAIETRLVPRAGAAPGLASYEQVDWSSIHTQSSELLNQLRLNIGRSTYDRLLCPPTQGTP